jgi:glycosyltransferase involved in cell wall biosynthesis
MTKILYIASNIPTPNRGNNRIIFTIAEKLSAGFDISFIFPAAFVFPPFSFMEKYRVLKGLKTWTDGRFTVNPVRYVRLPGKKMSYLFCNLIRPDSFVKKDSLPDICHAHFAMPDGYIAYKIKKEYGVPYIVSVRSSDVRHIRYLKKGTVYNRFITVFKNADTIIVHNKVQQELVERLGFDCVLIPHGIESDILIPDTYTKEEKPVIISVVAELIQRKNIDWVINAFNAYRGAKDVKLIIAGDGLYRKELETLKNERTNISFMGKITHDRVLELLESSHIFALPAVNETFGLVYLEAAAKKNAVICHQNEGVDGLFEENEEMMFCRDEKDFEQMLFTLIDDIPQRMKIAQAACDKVKKYTWKNITDKYIYLYKKLISND